MAVAAGIAAGAASTTIRPSSAVYEGVARDEWVDANGHMNLAYYVVLFDAATDVLFECLDLGVNYREVSKAALFAVETHTIYRRELVARDRVRVVARLLGATSKRVHVAHEMFHPDGDCAAMQEILFVHVDLKTRRPSAIPENVAASLALAGTNAVPPTWIGRKIIPLN